MWEGGGAVVAGVGSWGRAGCWVGGSGPCGTTPKPIGVTSGEEGDGASGLTLNVGPVISPPPPPPPLLLPPLLVVTGALGPPPPPPPPLPRALLASSMGIPFSLRNSSKSIYSNC